MRARARAMNTYLSRTLSQSARTSHIPCILIREKKEGQGKSKLLTALVAEEYLLPISYRATRECDETQLQLVGGVLHRVALEFEVGVVGVVHEAKQTVLYVRRVKVACKQSGGNFELNQVVPTRLGLRAHEFGDCFLASNEVASVLADHGAGRDVFARKQTITGVLGLQSRLAFLQIKKLMRLAEKRARQDRRQIR